jgi:hypothetical protein
MIVFNLSCGNDHLFEGWFESAANFEAQRDTNLLSCPVCGSPEIHKELHAPYVNTGAPRVTETRLAAPDQQALHQAFFNKAMARLADQLVAHTEDVGEAFPEEARKIHYREAPERGIRGHATPDEISDLREEGIEVVSVPIPKYRLGNPH